MNTPQEHEGRRANAGRKGDRVTINAMSILRRLRPTRNPRPTEEAVLARARAETGRMRRTFELRESAPAHVRRAWCEDCEAVVELVDETRCPCGSRSTVVVSRSWAAPKAEAA